MNADSFEPPARSGAPRGCGSLEVAFVEADVTEDGGGDRMKPPLLDASP